MATFRSGGSRLTARLLNGTPTMSRAGWNRNSFIGEEVIVEAHQARQPIVNGFYLAHGRRVTLVDVNRVVYCSSDDRD